MILILLGIFIGVVLAIIGSAIYVWVMLYRSLGAMSQVKATSEGGGPMGWTQFTSLLGYLVSQPRQVYTAVATLIVELARAAWELKQKK